MDFFVGGYFLVRGSQSAEWMNKTLLPTKFWTVSSCICEIYPDRSILSRVSTLANDYQKILNLDEEGFKSLQDWSDEMMTKNELGWPNVFLAIEVAKQFYDRYLRHLSDIKLLSIALSEPNSIEFCEENEPGAGEGGIGIYKKLQQRQLIEKSAIARGFEILGYENWCEFHSFVCNSLETDYKNRLKISLNHNGLIDRYEDAIAAANYTNLDEVGAEPVLWQPWLISEYILPT